MSKEKKTKININSIIAKAQAAYGKKETGLAQQLASGSTISRPKDESDFVVWTRGTHWRSLTGLHGLPYGRIVQIAGKPDSGKSTHASVFMKEAQDQNVVVVLWDSEKKFSKVRFEKMGGQPDELLTVNTNNIINGIKGVAHFVHAIKEADPEQKILVVWDSVGGSVNSSEDNEENEDYSKQPGISAKETSFAVRKLNKLINQYIDKENGKDSIAVLLINQTYSSIGMGAPTQIEKGGVEVTYLSSLILQLSRKGDLTRTKAGEKYKYGIVSRAKVRKNHLGEDMETIAEMDIVVSADGIQLAKDVKSHSDIKGWGDEDSGDEE